jgi:hypothetical protein
MATTYKKGDGTIKKSSKTGKVLSGKSNSPKKK